jgi:hypothetical protein
MLAEARVTRLSIFLASGPLFTAGSFMEMTKIAQMVWLLFSSFKVLYYFNKKTGRAIFWTNFSQTHLVTLAESKTRIGSKCDIDIDRVHVESISKT